MSLVLKATYIPIVRSKVEEVSKIIKESKLNGKMTYYEVIYVIENAMKIRITNIDSQTCRSNITRAITMAFGSSKGDCKKGYCF